MVELWESLDLLSKCPLPWWSLKQSPWQYWASVSAFEIPEKATTLMIRNWERKSILIVIYTKPGHEPWLKISWPSNSQPDLAIVKHRTFLSLAYLREIWPLLVLDNWKIITDFLVKAVMQDLLFSDVTAFNSLSADFESRLMRRSAFNWYYGF